MNSLQWLQFILSYSVQASLVIGVAWALERWTHAAESKSRIWTGCFVSLLGILAVGLLLPRLQWIHPWSQLAPSEILVIANAEHVLGRSLLAIWVLGCGVMVVRWVFRFWELRRFIQSCPVLRSDDISKLRTLVPLALLTPGGRHVIFLESPEELGPFCYQFHRPFVFLPPSLLAGDRTELQHVLHHELTHLQTQHPLQLFAQQLAQVVLWFHPLVWISGKRASLVREFVCDDGATEDGASTASYLRTLLHIVENRTKPQSSTFSIGRSASELKQRACRLISDHARSVGQRSAWPLAILFLSGAMVSQVWLPTNPLASSTTKFSPWPTWTAATLHAFDLNVRDFESFNARMRVHELTEHGG